MVPPGQNSQLFVTGELYSLDRVPLMGDPDSPLGSEWEWVKDYNL